MGGRLSGRSGGRPTIEGCGAIMLSLDELMAMRRGRDVFGVVCSGQVASNPYSINVAVRLGPEMQGGLTITHLAFNHLSSEVPAASYTVDLVAVPGQFGGRRWFMLCPRSGRRVLKLYLPNGAPWFAGREALGPGLSGAAAGRHPEGPCAHGPGVLQAWHALSQPPPADPSQAEMDAAEDLSPARRENRDGHGSASRDLDPRAAHLIAAEG